MNVHELRIGNYLYTDEGKINSVYLIAKSVIEFSNPHTICSPDFCSPVLLTEEWLIKFGLEQGGYDFLFWTKETKNGIFTICGDSEIEFGIRYNNEIELQLKYVHQLQNLYFALTGEELAITK